MICLPVKVVFLEEHHWNGWFALLNDFKWAEEVTTVASLVWVADEVSVEFLVTFKCDSTLGFVLFLKFLPKHKKLILSLPEILFWLSKDTGPSYQNESSGSVAHKPLDEFQTAFNTK